MRSHTSSGNGTRDYAIGIALVLVCAALVVFSAGRAQRLLREVLGAPRDTIRAVDDAAAIANRPANAQPLSAATPSSSASRPLSASAPFAPAAGAGTPSTLALPTPTAPVSTPAPAPAPTSTIEPAAPLASSPLGASAAAATSARSGAANVTPAVADIVRDLQNRRLTIPVAGIAAGALATGSFVEGRTGHTHEALDILAPRGTPIVAVEDGRVEKLFWSKAGGHTIYQFDPSARVAYYYAHLDRYADGLTEGATIHRGDTIGFVGSTGNARADAPHLHFAIFLLTPERQWWKGTAIDPYPVLTGGLSKMDMRE